MWKCAQEIEPSLVWGESLRKQHLSLTLWSSRSGHQEVWIFWVLHVHNPNLPVEMFSALHKLLTQCLEMRGHFKTFSEEYATDTNKSHRPFLQKKPRAKTLPFVSTLRHVLNVDMMLECEHCRRWRLLYSQYKLTEKDRTDLEKALQYVSFTCGSPLQELELPGKLVNVYIWDMVCEEPIERLYCTAKYPLICVHCVCSFEINFNTDQSHFYSQCSGYQKPKIPVC